MNIKIIRIIFVGKTRTSFWKEACEHYSERIGHYCKLEEVIIKDADAKLSPLQKTEQEGQAILKVLSAKDMPICLDELGKMYTSPKLADCIDAMALTHTPCFIVGGAYGLSQEVRNRAYSLIAFGPQTFPHELARVVLLEQLYRALSILKGTGYHH